MGKTGGPQHVKGDSADSLAFKQLNLCQAGTSGGRAGYPGPNGATVDPFQRREVFAVLAAAWDILKSHAALAYDPDGKCLYENFGPLNRG